MSPTPTAPTDPKKFHLSASCCPAGSGEGTAQGCIFRRWDFGIKLSRQQPREGRKAREPSGRQELNRVTRLCWGREARYSSERWHLKDCSRQCQEGRGPCSPPLPQRDYSRAAARPAPAHQTHPRSAAGPARHLPITAAWRGAHSAASARPSPLPQHQSLVASTRSSCHPPAPFPVQVAGPFLPTPEKIALVQPSPPDRPAQGSVHRRRLVTLRGLRGLGEGRLLVAVVADVGVTGVGS